MIIVSGQLHVDPSERDAYVAGNLEVIRLARVAPGCIDFQVTADPLDPGRINVFEQWDSVADVEAFRGSGPSDEQTAAILDAAVFQHVVASTEQL